MATAVLFSIGASVIIKPHTEATPSLSGVFLIAGPFWYDDEFWGWKEAELPGDAGNRIPATLPVTFYHGSDVPTATIRRLDGRNHQLDGDLSEVARDIRALAAKVPGR